MRKTSLLLPIFLGFFICLIYGLRKFDPTLRQLYFPALYLIPTALIFAGNIKLSEMGFRIGKPLDGLLVAFLLPTVLFTRYKLMGLTMGISPGWQSVVLGSVGEEVFFRGYLQGQFNKFFGPNVSILITNSFFMLVHVVKGYSLTTALMTFAIGAYFSFGRDKRGGDSALWGAIAHPLYNLIAANAPYLVVD
jgi:membrane protease YdiL (CAAX protease family)